MFLALMIATIALLALYFYRVYTKFSRAGINHLPVCPGLGHIAPAIKGEENIILCLMRNFTAFPEDRFVGQFEFVSPMILIRDLELLKKVSVKDFDHFVDRRQFTDDFDHLFGRNLLQLRGDEWKDKRARLRPAFTSSKIRLMIPFITEVTNHMIHALKNQLAESEEPYLVIDAKAMSSRFAVDVIASCAFGLKVDSYASDNEFYKMSEEIADINFIRGLKMFTFRCFPKFATLLRLQISSPVTAAFFRNVVLSTMKIREEQGIIREDMIHLLMEAKKGKLVYDKNEKNTNAGFATAEESNIGKRLPNSEWTDTDLVAQAVVFLFAGVETTSTSISFLMHQLAVNPEIQDKIVQEIRDHDAKKGGPFDYESIQTMNYMDMVISEILRLWPPAPIIDRICIKNYNLGKPNKTAKEDYIIRRGENIAFPIFFIHRDPEHFPEPDKFDPERFSDENKHKIKPFSYIPFGVGPRNCIGSRFALCEIKVMLYHVLKNFEFFPCEKTRVTPELTTDRLGLHTEGGLWIGMKTRHW